MKVLKTVEAVRAFRRSLSGSLGLVPTMGAMHEGHLSLVRLARERCDAVLVSIYVNPTQFNSTADYQTYPRALEDDLAMLTSLDVAAVFQPTDRIIYPDGMVATVKVADIGAHLEGAHRPGHFDGVATVVARLLNIATPDLACFGEKDYQQLLVVRRLVRDLNMAVQIIGGPTIRETDGLALSSRNALLTATERSRAPHLNQALDNAARLIGRGRPAPQVLEDEMAALTDRGFEVDYLALVDGATLDLLSDPKPEARLLVAAHLGSVRLIDNRAL